MKQKVRLKTNIHEDAQVLAMTLSHVTHSIIIYYIKNVPLVDNFVDIIGVG